MPQWLGSDKWLESCPDEATASATLIGQYGFFIRVNAFSRAVKLRSESTCCAVSHAFWAFFIGVVINARLVRRGAESEPACCAASYAIVKGSVCLGGSIRALAAQARAIRTNLLASLCAFATSFFQGGLLKRTGNSQGVASCCVTCHC